MDKSPGWSNVKADRVGYLRHLTKLGCTYTLSILGGAFLLPFLLIILLSLFPDETSYGMAGAFYIFLVCAMIGGVLGPSILLFIHVASSWFESRRPRRTLPALEQSRNLAMTDPYRSYDPDHRPAAVPAGPSLACFTYLMSIVAGGVVAPIAAIFYDLYAANGSGATLGLLLGLRGWPIPPNSLIYLAIGGFGLLTGPMLMAMFRGLLEVRRRAGFPRPDTVGRPTDARS